LRIDQKDKATAIKATTTKREKSMTPDEYRCSNAPTSVAAKGEDRAKMSLVTAASRRPSSDERSAEGRCKRATTKKNRDSCSATDRDSFNRYTICAAINDEK
jgi:hypothetical protein